MDGEVEKAVDLADCHRVCFRKLSLKTVVPMDEPFAEDDNFCLYRHSVCDDARFQRGDFGEEGCSSYRRMASGGIFHSDRGKCVLEIRVGVVQLFKPLDDTDWNTACRIL